MQKFSQSTQDLFDLNIQPEAEPSEPVEETPTPVSLSVSQPEPTEEYEPIPDIEDLEIKPIKRNSHRDVFEDAIPKPPKLKPHSRPASKLKTIIEELVLDDYNDSVEETLSKKPVKACQSPTFSVSKKPLSWREQKKQIRLENIRKEKEEKLRIKEQKRLEGIEKNRIGARERYWKKKKEQEDSQYQQEQKIKERIAVESKSRLNTFQKKEVIQKTNKPNDIDFAQFSEYMLRYENMKHQLQKQKEEELMRSQPQPQQQQYSPFPPNYPVHMLYNNRRKKNLF